MNWRRIFLGIAVVLIGLSVAGFLAARWYASASADPDFFETEIAAFEEADRASPPKPGGIVFVGSSSIRFWSSLEDDMTPLPVLKRGFGGAHLSHVIHNLDRVVIPYRPVAVVLYAGDNDIGSGKSSDRVVADYEILVARVHEALPGASIYYLPIKPSKARFALWPEMSDANARIESITQGDPRLRYIDTATVLRKADGTPRDDVFGRVDGLHLNETGYRAWAEIVVPVLRSDFPNLSR